MKLFPNREDARTPDRPRRSMPFCAFPSGLRCTAILSDRAPSCTANRRGGSQDEHRLRTRKQYGELQDRTDSRHFCQAETAFASVA